MLNGALYESLRQFEQDLVGASPSASLVMRYYKRLWGNSSRILKIRSGHGPLPLCFTLSSRLVLPCKTARAKQGGRGSEGFSQASLPAGRQAKPRWGFASGPARIAPKPFVWNDIRLIKIVFD